MLIHKSQEKMFLIVLMLIISTFTEGASHRMIFDKTMQVKQLSVVEAHGILLLRADKGKIQSSCFS